MVCRRQQNWTNSGCHAVSERGREKVRVLITGGAGSMGRELAAAFVSQGDSIRVFDLPQCDFRPLEALGAEIVRGDITDTSLVRAAVEGMDAVVHLAALLPPASERDREQTFAINVEGTRRVVDAIRAEGGHAHLVFSSSVVTYGDTSRENPPVRVGHPQAPRDLYAESKVEAERVVLSAGVSYTVLRISGVAVPAFLNPPDVWPFQAEQRIEFVNRADAVSALLAATKRPLARNRVFIVAGGPSWQMRGREYVEAILTAMDVPPEEARYLDHPGWFDWYDTRDAQAVLQFQRTTFPEFLEQLRRAVAEALA